MNAAQQLAITGFFDSVSQLEAVGVIRSSRFLGDIGEFLAKEGFGVTLVNQLRQTGHDGTDQDGKVQIKFNNSTEGNNINVGNPKDYETLIVVIGPQSKLREEGHGPNEFRLYRYSKRDVESWRSKSGGYYCAKERLASCATKKVLTTHECQSDAEG
ncbi:DUF6998 domain-containing protein [Uliginosibacterium paludis]|uniref:DUF6998 domain-containing protein n=1 Tax=Uliginosibacterium paludis TaxID=1615952 RepID=A0ABV2CUF2_9RHOO